MIFILLTLLFNISIAQETTPAQLASQCFQHEVDLHLLAKGRLPDSDEADLLIDACMLKYEKRRKELEREVVAKPSL